MSSTKPLQSLHLALRVAGRHIGDRWKPDLSKIRYQLIEKIILELLSLFISRDTLGYVTEICISGNRPYGSCEGDNRSCIHRLISIWLNEETGKIGTLQHPKQVVLVM